MRSHLEKDFGSLPQRALGITEPNKKPDTEQCVRTSLFEFSNSNSTAKLQHPPVSGFVAILMTLSDLMIISVHKQPEHCSKTSLLWFEERPQGLVLLLAIPSDSLLGTRQIKTLWSKPLFGWNNSLEPNKLLWRSALDWLPFSKSNYRALWWMISTSADNRKDNSSNISLPRV